MAKTKKPKETITPSDELIAQAVAEAQALIAEGKTKVEAAMTIYLSLPQIKSGRNDDGVLRAMGWVECGQPTARRG